jgi:hypothetical protein
MRGGTAEESIGVRFDIRVSRHPIGTTFVDGVRERDQLATHIAGFLKRVAVDKPVRDRSVDLGGVHEATIRAIRPGCRMRPRRRSSSVDARESFKRI